jgi:hypothetical protein
VTLLWFAAFAWTIALEQPIYTLALRRHVRRWWTPCAIALAVNAITHPLLWFAFPRFAPYWQYVVAGELCVIAVEAVIVALVIRRGAPAIAASVAANTVSTLVGLALLSAAGA